MQNPGLLKKEKFKKEKNIKIFQILMTSQNLRFIFTHGIMKLK